MTNLKKNPKKLALNLASSPKTTVQENDKNNLYKQGPACILPNLYLGSYYNALDGSQLNILDINCIINVASEVQITTIPTVKEYHHIRWTHCQKNLAHVEFAQAISKIQLAHHRQKKVLIHCQQGIERSAALVIAYLLCQNWSLDRALKYVQEKAPGIRPNMELLYQLQEYEKSIIVPTSKHNIQTRTRRSESIACCKTSTTLSKSSLAVNNNQRPRASSFRDHVTPTFLSVMPVKKTSNIPQNKKSLATAALIILLATTAIYQQQRQGEVEESNSHPNSPFYYMKPVYPIF
ncbi:protein-tyrosine phosphatase-like protein [Pilaira anomala]|nr:protein-tyrosine phosphatase-like protein [Pilaira anomala]